MNKTSLFGFSSSVLGMKYMQAKRLKFLEIYNYGLNFLSNSWPDFLRKKKLWQEMLTDQFVTLIQRKNPKTNAHAIIE